MCAELLRAFTTAAFPVLNRGSQGPVFTLEISSDFEAVWCA